MGTLHNQQGAKENWNSLNFLYFHFSGMFWEVKKQKEGKIPISTKNASTSTP